MFAVERAFDEAQVAPLPAMEEWQLFDQPRVRALHARMLSAARLGERQSIEIAQEIAQEISCSFPAWTLQDFEAMCVGVFTFGWDGPKQVYKVMFRSRVEMSKCDYGTL